ncbi:hypothetical protein Tco_0526837 [Tanacetum coccineum]
MSTTSAHLQALAYGGSETRPPMPEIDDLMGDDLKQYEADIKAMNLILISIPNDIYNSVDACANARDMRDRVKRLMQGTELSEIYRESRFNNEFDQFAVEPEESITSVYNRFSQLINDLRRNNVTLPNVTISTLFLNCLQPEWYKYVTMVRLAKNVKDGSYDKLFNHLQQYEKLVIASRVKKVAKTHDPLTLVAHTSSSSSRSPPPYYVTHPPYVVDYDDDYQGETFSDDQEDSLTSAMILLARASTQRYSIPINNRLHISSNTRNQAVVQADRVNIQSKNVRNGGRNARRSYNTQEESAESINVRKETGNVQRTLQTSSSGNATNYFMEQILLAKKDEAGVILSSEQNDFFLADANQMEETEELSVNICMMARIRQATADFDEGPSYDYAFISEVQTPSTIFMNPLFSNSDHEQKYHEQPEIVNSTNDDDKINSDIIFDDLNVEIQDGNDEHDKNGHDQHDNELELLAINAYKEAEKQLTLAKKNENVVVKMSNSVQAMFMLGPKPLSVYDPQLKHGLGYENSYTLKQAISANPKLYDASYLHSLNVHDNVRDIEEILKDATKSIQKEFPKEVRDMMNAFESIESDLDATLKQNEILTDLLLGATLKHDVERCVLMCSYFMNDNLKDEI